MHQVIIRMGMQIPDQLSLQNNIHRNWLNPIDWQFLLLKLLMSSSSTAT